MSDNRESFTQAVLSSAMIAVVAALAALFLGKRMEPIKQTSILIGSILFATLVGYLLRNSALPVFWREFSVACCAAFAPKLWTLIEKKVLKYADKKIDNVLPPDND